MQPVYHRPGLSSLPLNLPENVLSSIFTFFPVDLRVVCSATIITCCAAEAAAAAAASRAFSCGCLIITSKYVCKHLHQVLHGGTTTSSSCIRLTRALARRHLLTLDSELQRNGRSFLPPVWHTSMFAGFILDVVVYVNNNIRTPPLRQRYSHSHRGPGCMIRYFIFLPVAPVA